MATETVLIQHLAMDSTFDRRHMLSSHCRRVKRSWGVNRFLVKFPVVSFGENLFRFSKLYVDRQTNRETDRWEDMVKFLAHFFFYLFCIFALYQLTTTTTTTTPIIIIMSTTLSVYTRGLYETSVFVFSTLFETHFWVIYIIGNFVNE